VLDTQKQVFEELLWEHQDLNEAFAALKLEHNHCQGSLELPGFFCTGSCLHQTLTTCFFCAAALPEASVDNLFAQVAALKGKPRLPVCFLRVIFCTKLTPSGF
jgi:hypothetical protein